MDMKKLMQEAKKMQVQLQKDQEALEKNVYEGNSSIVSIKINGKYEVVDLKIKADSEFTIDDMEMLEDMIVVAMNDALRKIAKDKDEKMSKYGQGFSGLM